MPRSSQTYPLSRPPVIVGYGSAGGRKEKEGPLGRFFDHTCEDDTFQQSSWEMAETTMQQLALESALKRAKLEAQQLDFLLAGDLLNQCISSAFAARWAGVPYLGLYGACSTTGESVALASLLLAGGWGNHAAAMTSSHFCSAERQYRTPLEYGCQRPPTAQWTATAAGAVVLSAQGEKGPVVSAVTIGKVMDKGVKDPANMGAAMAPAAYDTLRAHFQDTGRSPADYDLILTGDLGQLGWEIVSDFFSRDGCPLSNYNDCGLLLFEREAQDVHCGGSGNDCGLLLFEREAQDVHCGGSGCGCSAAVLTTMVLPGLQSGRWKRVLFCPTGALLSPVSTMQGESIPGICHAIVLEGGAS